MRRTTRSASPAPAAVGLYIGRSVARPVAALDRASRDYLVALQEEFRGNVTRAADHAGVERESLHRLLRRHGVRSDDFKP